MLESELITTFDGNRGTEYTATVAQHIVYMFGRNKFGSHDKVTFVFAVFIVNYDDELAFFKVLYSFFDGGELECIH